MPTTAGGPVLVGHHPGYLGGGSGADEFALLVWGRGDGHGDDEAVDALEGGGERRFVIIVYDYAFHTGGEFALAICAGESGDVVLAACDEVLGDGFTNLASCANDGDVLDAVFEAGGLLVCVLVCHDVIWIWFTGDQKDQFKDRLVELASQFASTMDF